MAESARHAVEVGASSIDINFGCPAPVVNRHDGGASLLRSPCRIREVVEAVVSAVNVPVSAKLRLGWDSIEDIHENAAMAAEGGAAWLTNRSVKPCRANGSRRLVPDGQSTRV